MAIVDGRQIAEKILSRVADEIKSLPFRPVFCDVLVGDDPVQVSYVRIKGRTAERVGFKFECIRCPREATTEQVVEAVTGIQSIPDLAGLIVQLPLPDHVRKKEILDAITPSLDVDCIGDANSQAFYRNEGMLVPPTAGAIMEILGSLALDLRNKKIVVVGRGELVGRPVAHLLQAQGVSPEVLDRFTFNAGTIMKSADVIISGTGQPGLIKGDMIKEGAVVIDAGTAESGGGIVGDVDFDSVAPKAAYVSPVPGGVGPVTVAKLLENVLKTAKTLNKNKLH